MTGDDLDASKPCFYAWHNGSRVAVMIFNPAWGALCCPPGGGPVKVVPLETLEIRSSATSASVTALARPPEPVQPA